MKIPSFQARIASEIDRLYPSERTVIEEVWQKKTEYVRWAANPRLLLPNCVRIKYHPDLPNEVREEARRRGVTVNTLSNGPAIMCFLLAGGERPLRSNNHGWDIDHIYDGKFPWEPGKETLHAVKNGNHFTQSTGLVAIHPIAEALRDEYFSFSWLVRHEAFLKFNYDPDNVFCERVNEYGFKIA